MSGHDWACSSLDLRDRDDDGFFGRTFFDAMDPICSAVRLGRWVPDREYQDNRDARSVSLRHAEDPHSVGSSVT